MIEEPTPLDFLKAVYLNEGLPLSVRMRAAIEAAPYMHAKLSATAILQSADFSEKLERAILRSGVKLIEAKPLPQPDQGPFGSGTVCSLVEAAEKAPYEKRNNQKCRNAPMPCTK
jgi:hypothetical protein